MLCLHRHVKASLTLDLVYTDIWTFVPFQNVQVKDAPKIVSMALSEQNWTDGMTVYPVSI
jgi:hypothetical protein